VSLRDDGVALTGVNAFPAALMAVNPTGGVERTFQV
jgi:hypothetical protein